MTAETQQDKEVVFEDGQAYLVELEPGRNVIAMPVVGGYAFQFEWDGRTQQLALTFDAFTAMTQLAIKIDEDRGAIQPPVSSIVLPS